MTINDHWNFITFCLDGSLNKWKDAQKPLQAVNSSRNGHEFSLQLYVFVWCVHTKPVLSLLSYGNETSCRWEWYTVWMFSVWEYQKTHFHFVGVELPRWKSIIWICANVENVTQNWCYLSNYSINHCVIDFVWLYYKEWQDTSANTNKLFDSHSSTNMWQGFQFLIWRISKWRYVIHTLYVHNPSFLWTFHLQ